MKQISSPKIKIPTLSDYAKFAAKMEPSLLPADANRVEEQPLVSIVTICRNTAITLPLTLASVRSQTYPWIEHLVIDGASTDGTLEVLTASRDHLAGIVSEPDQGISDAFNKGIALARGSIIGILNAGDEYLPHCVERALEALAMHPEAGFVFGGCRKKPRRCKNA